MKALTPLAALLIGLGGAAGAQDITVSSKIDTEGGLLGNMILLALQDAGLPVVDAVVAGVLEGVCDRKRTLFSSAVQTGR